MTAHSSSDFSSRPPSSIPQSVEYSVVAKNLSKTYGASGNNVRVLNNLDVAFPQGQFTAIMGASGSGKSTLLHVLSTLDTADEDTKTSIMIDGNELYGKKDAELSRFRSEKIGFIFQAFNLIPTLTAEQNIELPAGLSGQSVDTLWKNQLIRSLGLSERLAHKPAELSGGQQQRVAICRALLTRPAVVFADEPTGNLDTHSSREVLELLREASQKYGQTILMVTHDPQAASYADCVVLMKDGALVNQIDNPTRESVLDALTKLGEEQ